MPAITSLPQKPKSAWPGSPSGQRQSPEASSSSEQRFTLPTRRQLDRRVERHDGRRCRVGDRAEDPRDPRLRPRSCGRRRHPLCQPRRPPAGLAAGRQAQAMELADDGIARDADLGGDLAAGHSRGDVFLELVHALRGPGCSCRGSCRRSGRSRPCTSYFCMHCWPHDSCTAFLGRGRATGFATDRPAGRTLPRSAKSVLTVHHAAITEPHPHCRNARPPLIWTTGPVRRSRLRYVERNRSPGLTVSRFNSPAKS